MSGPSAEESIADAFFDVVEEQPDTVAVITSRGRSWTYREIHEAARRELLSDDLGGRAVNVAAPGPIDVEFIVRCLAAWAANRCVLVEPTVADAAAHLPPVGRNGQEAALVVTTSGTSGVPSAAVHSHRGLLCAAVMTLRLAVGDPPPLDCLETSASARHALHDLRRQRMSVGRLLATTPASTIAGVTVMLRSLLNGDTLVEAPATNARSTLEACEAFAVEVLATSPTALQALFRLARAGHQASQPPLPNLAVAGVGGGPVSPRLAHDVQRLFGCLVSVGYGTTETGGAVAYSLVDAGSEAGSFKVGLPLPGIEVRVAGDEDVGRLEVRSPASMLGQIGPHGFQASSTWIDTGDLASLDEDGSITLHGRADFTILRGSRRLDPAVMETLLTDLDGIAAVAIVGVTSRVAGETDLVALVEPLEGARLAEEPDLRQRLTGRLPPGSPTIRRAQVVSRLPRARDGEVARGRLAALVEPS